MKMFDSIEFDPFSGLRLSKFWQMVCGEPSETVVHILVFAVSSVALPLRTTRLNIFRVSTRFGKLPEHASKLSLYACMKASLWKLGPFLIWLIYLSEGLGICASMQPRLYPDVGTDATILERAFCFRFNALKSFESIAKALL